MWATKFCNIIKEQNEETKGLDSVFHKQVGMDSFSGTRIDSNRRQSDPAVLMTTERGSFNMLNDQMEKLTKTVEQIAGRMTTLRSDMTTLRSDMTTWRSDMTTREKMVDEDIESMKIDIKNCLEMQKDTVKSYLNMKKENSAVKRRFETVYGRNFFQDKNWPSP